MALHPSGSAREEVELLQIETAYFSFIVRGRPYHPRYEGLQTYQSLDFHDEMECKAGGKEVESIKVFDVDQQQLVLLEKGPFRPIFFEQTAYQFLIIPKNDRKVSFHHEFHLFRNAVSELNVGSQSLLMGQLNFGSEVGLSTFEVRSETETLLTTTIEIFPAKLDYKEDYRQLLNEVNDEIYNLAYHFLRKTHLGATIKIDGQPTMSEFYRLFTYHFDSFIKAITRIEAQPHHNLQKTYELERADKVKRLDSYSRKQLRKNGRLFVEHPMGLDVNGKTLLPSKALNRQMYVVYNTPENQYIKWMMERLIEKLIDLTKQLSSRSRYQAVDEFAVVRSEVMEKLNALKHKLRTQFWQGIKAAPMTQFSTVLQMAPGYRDVLQIYLTVSKGLALFGQQYQMSVKNVAELYEYWTFLKVGQILSKRYLSVSQDVVSATSNGLFVNLDASKSASRLFEHPLTGEKMKLTYQKREWNPTTTQLPDIVLSVTKKGMNQSFNYVFDAKYRIDFAAEESYYGRKYQIPGPMEEDINTMHRYRDAIVHKRQGPYEQTAFGAYVLFPFGFEEGYREHQFFKSIEEVNIGGLPFLPSTTKLVEELIENIVEKSPSELHDEGILPQGTKHKWQSELDEFALITNVSTIDNYKESLHKKEYKIPIHTLPRDWRKATHLALYVGKKVKETNGVVCYGRIEDISIRDQQMTFCMESWQSIDPIKPVHYGIANTMMTTLGQLKEARELPELFMKSKEETYIWKLLRRVSDKVKIELTGNEIDYAEGIKHFTVKDIEVTVEQTSIQFKKEEKVEIFEPDELDKSLYKIFRSLVAMMKE